MFKNSRYLINKYKIFIVLAATIPILGFFFWRQLGPPRVPPPNPIFGPLPQPETQFSIQVKPGITYRFSFSKTLFAQFPDQLSVYKIKKLSKEEILDKYSGFATELGFSIDQTTQTRGGLTFYIWEEPDKFLKVNSQTGQFVFQGKTALSSGPITPPEAEELAKQKLIDWDLLQLDTKTSINYFVLAGMQFKPVTNPNLADVYQITFSSSVDTYPLIGFGPAQDLASVKVGKDGQILTIDYFYHQFERENVGTYPLKSSETVLSQVQQGQGEIFSLKTKAGVETNLTPENQIKTIDLTSVDLAYYETVEKQEYLQPIYLFLGEAKLEKGQALEVSLYLPAISSEWLAQPSPTPTSRFKAE